MKIIKYYKGSLSFSAYGGYFEQFLNDVKKQGLHIWNIKKRDGIFYGKTDVKRYLELSRLARKSGVRLRIKKRNGLPFLLHRYHRRIGLLIGVIFFFCFLSVMQNFIWEIEVSGNQALSETEILERAKELGLHRGTTIYGTDFKSLQKNLEYRLPGIAWLSLNRKGSLVVIELHESEEKPEITDRRIPCNLIAKKDGLIKYMEIYQGQKMVKVNETVCKGDILVSGVVEDKFQQTRLLHADGSVIAETYLEETFIQPFEIEEKVYTGKKKEHNYIHLFGFRVPLFLSFGLNGNYDKEQTENPLILFGKNLPVGLEKLELKEYQLVKKTYTQAEAEQVLKGKMEVYETELSKKVKMISKNTERLEQNGAFVIKVSYICEENIAQKEEIMINE